MVNPHRHSTGKMKNTGYSFTSQQENDDKGQKKGSLKEMVRNKRTKDELQKTPSNLSSNYVQKYYRKSGANIPIYKENKIGKYVWYENVFNIIISICSFSSSPPSASHPRCWWSIWTFIDSMSMRSSLPDHTSSETTHHHPDILFSSHLRWGKSAASGECLA